jgi:CheY-like chemotaxis protein
VTEMATTEELRILLAEDNDDHAFFTQRALRDGYGAGLEIDTVRDGQEALDYLNRSGRFTGQARPHLIVLDLKMPRRNGLEVLAEVKADAALRSIPVVVLSSSDGNDDIDATYRLGANSYVTKPVSLEGLRAGVSELASYWLARSALPAPPV